MNVRQKIQMLLPRRLVSARESLGITQVELARKTGLRQDWISHFECGRRIPAADTLLILAEALICSTDYLLGRFDNIKPKKGK